MDNVSFIDNTISIAQEQIALIKQAKAKIASDLIIQYLIPALHKNNKTLESNPISSENLNTLVSKIYIKELNKKQVTQVLDILFQSPQESIDTIITKHNIIKPQADINVLIAIIDKLILDNPAQVKQYKEGKTKIIGFFVGQVMKQTAGAYDPAVVNQTLTQCLQKSA